MAGKGFPPCQGTIKLPLLPYGLPIACGGPPSIQVPRRPRTSFCSVEASASFKFGSDRPFATARRFFSTSISGCFNTVLHACCHLDSVSCVVFFHDHVQPNQHHEDNNDCCHNGWHNSHWLSRCASPEPKGCEMAHDANANYHVYWSC